MKKLMLIFVAIFFFLRAAPNCQQNSTSYPHSPSPTVYNVEYKVTGTANKVDIIIENKDGETSMYSDIPIPWSYSFEREQGEFVYISAQNCGETGSVTVTIYRDGDVFRTATSDDLWATATVYGTL